MSQNVNPGPAQSQTDKELRNAGFEILFDTDLPERFFGSGLENLLELQHALNKVIDAQFEHMRKASDDSTRNPVK